MTLLVTILIILLVSAITCYVIDEIEINKLKKKIRFKKSPLFDPEKRL